MILITSLSFYRMTPATKGCALTRWAVSLLFLVSSQAQLINRRPRLFNPQPITPPSNRLTPTTTPSFCPVTSSVKSLSRSRWTRLQALQRSVTSKWRSCWRTSWWVWTSCQTWTETAKSLIVLKRTRKEYWPIAGSQLQRTSGSRVKLVLPPGPRDVSITRTLRRQLATQQPIQVCWCTRLMICIVCPVDVFKHDYVIANSRLMCCQAVV